MTPRPACTGRDPRPGAPPVRRGRVWRRTRARRPDRDVEGLGADRCAPLAHRPGDLGRTTNRGQRKIGSSAQSDATMTRSIPRTRCTVGSGGNRRVQIDHSAHSAHWRASKRRAHRYHHEQTSTRCSRGCGGLEARRWLHWHDPAVHPFVGRPRLFRHLQVIVTGAAWPQGRVAAITWPADGQDPSA